MRLVRVDSPEAHADAVAKLAFDLGIEQVTVFPLEARSRDGSVQRKQSIDMATATPVAKAFVDRLLAAPYFDRREFTVKIRQPRTILSKTHVSDLTCPLVEPGPDLLEELWQFSHITFGFVGRVLLGAALLGFGLLKNKMLLTIAGLMFLPLLPLILGMSFGTWTREWRLVGRAAGALLVGLLLTALAASLVGWMCGPPILYHDFLTMLPSGAISAAVGVAAALATADDVGRRELVGLAAAAQIAILPAWFGLLLTAGRDEPPSLAGTRALTLVLNISALFVTSFLTYVALRFSPTASQVVTAKAG